MSLWRSDSCILGIGAKTAVLTSAKKPLPVTASLPLRPADWPSLGAQLAEQVSGPVVVTVADELARYLVIDPPIALQSLQDAKLWLAMRFEAVYGESPADWRLEADWQPGRATLACALPNVLLQGLHPLNVKSVAPAFLRIWNRHCHRLPRTGLWCWLDNGFLRVAYWREGAIVFYRQMRVAMPLVQSELQRLLAQEFARIEDEIPQSRFWSGSAAPSSWNEIAPLPEGVDTAVALAWLGVGA